MKDWHEDISSNDPRYYAALALFGLTRDQL